MRSKDRPSDTVQYFRCEDESRRQMRIDPSFLEEESYDEDYGGIGPEGQKHHHICCDYHSAVEYIQGHQGLGCPALHIKEADAKNYRYHEQSKDFPD
jgi:hypothetical protein